MLKSWPLKQPVVRPTVASSLGQSQLIPWGRYWSPFFTIASMRTHWAPDGDQLETCLPSPAYLLSALCLSLPCSRNTEEPLVRQPHLSTMLVFLLLSYLSPCQVQPSSLHWRFRPVKYRYLWLRAAVPTWHLAFVTPALMLYKSRLPFQSRLPRLPQYFLTRT